MASRFVAGMVAVSLLTGSAAQAALVAHWTMEEGSGATTANAVGGANDPIAGGAPWITAAAQLPAVPSGTTAALDFQGGDDLITSSYAGIAGGGARTVAFWVRVPADYGTLDSGLIAWGNSASNGQKWHLRVNNSSANGQNGGLRTEIQGTYITGDTDLRDGVWHHVASVYSPQSGVDYVDSMTVYVDGVPETFAKTGAKGSTGVVVNTVTSATITGSSAPVLIGGRRQASATTFVRAAMDDVRIYDHALSASEVAALVPEPSSAALLLVGAGLLAGRRRRR